jgi:hypothetical protein
MMDTGKASSECGKRDSKKADNPKEGEGIGRGKLGRMGMMGGWIKVGTHLNKGKKLTFGFPSGAYWDSWDVRQHFEN